MSKINQLLLAAAATLAVGASGAFAASPAVTKANGQYINGTGIPGNNFTVASGGGVEVALKARSFVTGQPLGYDTVNEYDVATGYAAGRDPLTTPGNTRAWWTLDYQFTPAA